MNNSGANNQQQKTKLSFPSEKTLLQAFKLSLKFTKPICTYFYLDSLKRQCHILNDGEDSILFKNEDEHTSPILNLYKSDNSYIIITNNTIYLIDGNTEIKKTDTL